MAKDDNSPPVGKVYPADGYGTTDVAWSDIPLPTSGGIIRTTFWNVVRYRSAVRQMAAYKAAVHELKSLIEEHTGMIGARIEHAKALQRFEDLPLILEEDRITDALSRRARIAEATYITELAERKLSSLQNPPAQTEHEEAKPRKKTAAEVLRDKVKYRQDMALEKERLIRDTKEFWKSHGVAEDAKVVTDAIEYIENSVFEHFMGEQK